MSSKHKYWKNDTLRAPHALNCTLFYLIWQRGSSGFYLADFELPYNVLNSQFGQLYATTTMQNERTRRNKNVTPQLKDFEIIVSKKSIVKRRVWNLAFQIQNALRFIFLSNRVHVSKILCCKRFRTRD